MKYGIVARDVWDEAKAPDGWPDNSFCIVFLNEDCTIALDEDAQHRTGIAMSSGAIFALPSEHYNLGELLGYMDLPIDVETVGCYVLQGDAIDAAVNMYTYANTMVATEAYVNKEIEYRRGLENLIDDNLWWQKGRNVAYFVTIACLIIFLLYVMYRIYIRTLL